MKTETERQRDDRREVDHGEHDTMTHEMGAMGSQAGMMPMAHGGHGAAMGGSGGMSGMMIAQPWVFPVVMALGVWLIVSPVTLGYRSAALTWNDVISGVLLIVLAALARKRVWAAWAAVLVGTWLLFAPLVFWAPEAASYLNDTLVGTLVIGFAMLIPMGIAMPGPEIPPGWSYNPASWAQRAPIIALGLFGFFASRYMAGYQLEHIGSVWDPFFGDGTARVLTSEVSRAFPVPDAGLGATIYLLEVLMTAMGDGRRWRTMPWMVLLFAVLVVPLGVTSIVLVILQPIGVGTWCTLCLLSAVAMLLAVPLALDEVVAMGQFLVRTKREGKSVWRAFWLGGDVPEGLEAARTRPAGASLLRKGWWGMTAPWTLLVSAALGGWLMLAPAVLGSEGGAANSDWLVGSLVVTWALIALAEVSRTVRWLNIPLGMWLVVAPWLLNGDTTTSLWNDVVVGLLLLVLSWPRGAVRDTYGSWDRFIR